VLVAIVVERGIQRFPLPLQEHNHWLNVIQLHVATRRKVSQSIVIVRIVLVITVMTFVIMRILIVIV
jgi:hypothetical protein